MMNLANRLRSAKPQGNELGKIAYTPGGLFDLILASLFINVLALAMPLTLLQVYDRIIPNTAEGTLIMLIIGVGSALLLEAGLRQGRSYVSGWMGARFEHLAGVAAVERLINVSIIDYERQGSGVHLERFNALGPLKEFYAGQAILALCDLPFAVLFLAAMFYLAGHLVLVPIALIIIFSITAIIVGGRLKNALDDRMKADDRRYSFIIEVLGGIHTVKGLAMEDQMIRRYERLQETCAAAEYNVALHSSSASSTGALFSQLVLFSVVGYGATFVIDGELTVGGLAACTMLAGRSMQPLQKAVGIWTRFQAIQLSLDRVRDLFKMVPEKPFGLPKLPPVRGELRLEDITFSYGKDKEGEDLPPIFDQVDLRIETGETIGITGAGSSGKTTLLYLMMGVFSPTAGRVTIDGLDLSEYEPSSIRHQIAYLPQEGQLFQGTILENVKADLELLDEREQTLIRSAEIFAEELDVREQLYKEGLTSKIAYLDAKRQLNTARGELADLISERERATEAILESESRLAEIETEAREQALAELSESANELIQVEEALIEASDRVRRLDIMTPVRGIVKGLRVHTVGGIVPPGEVISEIVPLDEELIVEAKIQPRDVGHVRFGQPVTVKVTTYDFARFGGISGELKDVSASTFLDEQGDPYYKGIISLDKSYVGGDPGQNRVMPGMTVQADIKTGKKTLFSYLLKPVYSSVSTSFRER